MQDFYNRKINYIRVSITDSCNLRCKYCMPEYLPTAPQNELLSYDEILRICKIMSDIGIKTVKVTGGEPLMRNGCVDFLSRLKNISGIENVTITTNGIMLPHYIKQLAEIGIDGINLSLDTLNPESYKFLTGMDGFETVITALNMAIDEGLKLKINCVILKDHNEDEIIPISKLAENFPIYVRFIELMPQGFGKKYKSVSSEHILKVLQNEYTDLSPDYEKHGFGPAKYYKSSHLKGGIGFISAMSNHFCNLCNRVRLTSVGFLRLCLYHEDGLDLRQILRSNASDSEIQEKIISIIGEKPEKHFFEREDSLFNSEGMSRIGG